MAVDLGTVGKKLQSNEDIIENLEKINAVLISDNSARQASEVLSAVSPPLLFSLLEGDDPHQVQLTCAVLDKLLVHIPAPELVKYGQYLELGLQYPQVKVASTCLQALLRLSDAVIIQELVLSPTLLHLITQLLAGEDLQCAMLVTKLLLKFSARAEILEGKMKGQWLTELGQLLGHSDIVRYRVFDLLVQTCLEGGAKCFVIIEDSGYLKQLVEELDKQDPLVKMNCIELLSSLSEVPEGIHFLDTNKVLDTLYQTLSVAMQDVMGALVIPAILKFFGRLCLSLGSEAVTVCGQYPQFLELTLKAALEPQDETLWGVAIDTIGLLSSSLSGRTLLLSKQQDTNKVLKKLGQLLDNAPSVTRCRALRCVSMLVSCEEDCNYEQSLSRQWLLEIHPRAFSLLLSVARQPFTDLRLAGLAVLVGMSRWEWGQREMQSSPGFLEYLLDRKTEPDREGKEMKFEIVHHIASSECCETIWASMDLLKIKKYDREGPFFFIGDTTVAIEGAS